MRSGNRRCLALAFFLSLSSSSQHHLSPPVLSVSPCLCLRPRSLRFPGSDGVSPSDSESQQGEKYLNQSPAASSHRERERERVRHRFMDLCIKIIKKLCLILKKITLRAARTESVGFRFMKSMRDFFKDFPGHISKSKSFPPSY